MRKWSIRLVDDSGSHHGVGRMNSVFKKSIHNLFILFTIILLSHCTGVGSAPGGAPGNFEGGLGALDTVGTSGPGDVAGNPAAPVSQPTEDGIPRLKPQIILARVLPPKQKEVPSHQAGEIAQTTQYVADWNGSEFAEVEDEVSDSEGPVGPTALEVNQEPLEAQQVPGPFEDSQPYVWVAKMGEAAWATKYEATNDYGYANLELYFPIPKDEECTTEFRFFACDQISGRVWVARPVVAVCPIGDWNAPYQVDLQLIMPVTDTHLQERSCPPTPPEASQNAPVNELYQ